MSSARALRRAPVLVLLGLLVPALSGCSGGDKEAAAKSARVDSPAGSTLELEVGGVHIETMGAPGTLGDADRDAIVDTVRRYVIAATIDPLHGKPVGDLTPSFTLPAVAALAGLDRVAALDEGVPKATSVVKVSSAPMILTALVDPMGGINLVGTSLYIDARTTASDGPVRVKRQGELVLTRDGAAWRISSFRLAADRSGAGLGTAPTSTSTPGSAP